MDRGLWGPVYGCFPQKGFHFGVPDNKDYGILGSIFGSPYRETTIWGSARDAGRQRIRDCVGDSLGSTHDNSVQNIPSAGTRL